MGYMEKHSTWFARLTGDASGRQAALKAGISISTLNRQLGKDEIDPGYVIALSRAYGASVTSALVSTGYITAEEASEATLDDLVEVLSDQALIRELARRIDSDPSAWFGTFGELQGDSTPPEGKVYNLEDYAADSSPDEPEPGEDGFHDGP